MGNEIWFWGEGAKGTRPYPQAPSPCPQSHISAGKGVLLVAAPNRGD
jgi:hypothetical protein